MRPIDADEVQKYFETSADACIPCESEYEEGQADAYTSAADYVSDCETIDVVPKWISVKDRLPEDAGREVFVTAINVFGQKNTTVAFMGYGDNKWHFSVSSYRAWRVTHWMEKPEPAKEADDEDC